MTDVSAEIDELLKADIPEPEVVEKNNNVERQDLAKALERLDLQFKQEELKGRKQDREQRRSFAKNIFWVVVAYLAVVLTILFFHGFGLIYISDSVLIALLGTTTANVISLLVIVAKYLFHTKE